MLTVVLFVHLFIAVVMIALILLQKTEGGAAGAGFSASSSVESMMRPRARPNPIGRATSFLGIAFFVTSLLLALLTRPDTHAGRSIMSEPAAVGAPAVPKVNDQPTVPTVPTEPSTPAAPAAPQK